MIDGRSVYTPLFSRRVLGRAGHRLRGHRPHRGDPRPGRHGLGRQRRQRRDQHHHEERPGHPRPLRRDFGGRQPGARPRRRPLGRRHRRGRPLPRLRQGLQAGQLRQALRQRIPRRLGPGPDRRPHRLGRHRGDVVHAPGRLLRRRVRLVDRHRTPDASSRSAGRPPRT